MTNHFKSMLHITIGKLLKSAINVGDILKV